MGVAVTSSIVRDRVERGRSEEEIPLVGGISLRGIVRVGGTVRRPLKPDSAVVHELLEYFEAVGFEGAPRFPAPEGEDARPVRGARHPPAGRGARGRPDGGRFTVAKPAPEQALRRGGPRDGKDG
jgi:hypothetical protein